MIGSRLESLLEIKKIKPGRLATMTGINKSTIYSIIKRNNKNVDYSIMEKIADALEVPVEYFHVKDTVSEVNNDQSTNDSEDILLKECTELFVKLDEDKKLAILAAMKAFLKVQ